MFYYNPALQSFRHLSNNLQLAEKRNLVLVISAKIILKKQLFFSVVRQPNASFQWLDAYQREDLLEIDRNIADGSATVKNRESKLREELLMRESEYICFDEFR